MSDVNWNFDAPQDFIDFTNIDDTDDNIDDYFNRNHEKSGLPANFIDNVEEETNQDSVNLPDISPVKQESETELEHNEEKANSTFTIHSPSKTDQHCAIIDEVLNDETKAEEVKTDALDVETEPKLEAPDIIIKREKPDAEKIGTEIQQGPLEKTNIKPIDTEKNTQNENEAITQTEAGKTENTDPPKKPYSNIMTPSRLASWNSASRHVNAQNPKPLKNSGKSATPKAKAQMRRSLRQRENVFKPQEPPNKKQKFHHDPKKMTNHRRALTSEERQLDEVKSAKEKAKQTKRTSELSLQKIRSKSSPSWNVVSKPRLTTPREFHFQTSERAAKLHPMATRANCSTSIDFTKDLRKHEPSPNKLKTTVVKPFHFSDDKKTVKRKLEKDMVETKPFVPMAKAIHDFHKNTPKRFRAKTTTTGKAGPVKAMKVTIPKTPQFSAIRTRPILTMSEKEKEELDVQEIKNNQFKANEVRRSVTNPAPLKKVEKKPLTVPVGFNLTKQNPAKQPDQKEKPKPFKARPLPLAILEKTTGIKEKQVIKATVPQSPAFALKHRVKPAPVQPVKEEPKPTFYHPAPKSSAPPTVKSTPVITKPEPFSFDKNDTERFAKKKEKINEIINQESKPVAFVAQAMPVMEPGQLRLPEKKTKDPTKPLPFNLSTDTKAARRAEKFSRNVEDEIKHLRDRTLFKANVNIDNVLHKPWKPKKVEREALVTEKFNLHSDERAKERQIFEEKLAQEREEKKRLIEEETKRKEIAEKEEIARLRRSMEHKATEVKHYTRVKVTHSEKKLTEPCSPQFSTRFKK